MVDVDGLASVEIVDGLVRGEIADGLVSVEIAAELEASALLTWLCEPLAPASTTAPRPAIPRLLKI